MAQTKLTPIRALLGAKPRPVGWAERRARIEEVGSVWPVAADVELNAGRCRWRAGGVVDRSRQRPVPRAAVLSRRRLLLGLDRQPSPHGHRGRARRARIARLPSLIGWRPNIRFPAALDDALSAWRFLREQGIAAAHIAVGGDSAGGGLTVALINRLRDARRAPGLRLADARRGRISPCRARRWRPRTPSIR